MSARRDHMVDMSISINGEPYTFEVEDPNMPLLWVLRDLLGLTGTKFGCGVGQCGACTIHLNGVAVRSCQTTLSSVGERTVTTIEGLSTDLSHPLQRAWLAENVPQCGY